MEKRVRVIGFNVLKVDFPMLIYKANMLEIMKIEEALELWRQVYVEDLLHALLPLNEFRFWGLRLERVQEILKGLFEEYGYTDVEIHEVRYPSEEIPRFYDNREYKKIEDHLRSELDFMSDLRYILTQKIDYLINIWKDKNYKALFAD